MASTSSSSSSKQDVYISYEAKDTGNNFTSYLKNALHRKQIQISDKNAIRDSTLSIIVFSENYASSTRCLSEVVEIVECRKTKGMMVVPVFYDVSPSEVRKQNGKYQKAFEGYGDVDVERVEIWKEALVYLANLSGWDLAQHPGTESEFVENITQDILKRLNHVYSSNDNFNTLFGITSRIESIESMLLLERDDIVRIIGIWGMGGLGKTTLARALFLRIANQFECHCFLENVKDIARYGPNHLQEKLLFEIFEDKNVYINSFTINKLRRKKVLIILDDVDDLDHIDFFLKGHSSFGHGSRIILTSRDKQVLKTGVDEWYELEELNYDEALQLFSIHAFKQNYPPENYIELSTRVIYYANGNPLALKVLGRFLFDRNVLEWRNSLEKLKRYPNFKIQNILMISYDGLDYPEKEIFLWIACFFEGEDKNRVIKILNDCGLFADIGVAVLIDRCLLTIRLHLLRMHDLVQEMGRAIVLQESINEPGNRSRLWNAKEITELFSRNSGTDRVKSIALNLSQIRDKLHLNPDAFMKMPRLQFLKFQASFLFEDQHREKLHLNQGLESLPDGLRYLHWHGYPLKSLPPNINLDHLVELEMPYSNIEHLWEEDKAPQNLRRIDLSHSLNLLEPPNITNLQNLESMILTSCTSIHKLPRLPFNIKDLRLSFTSIQQLPTSISSLHKLNTLKLDNCTNLQNLPTTLHHVTSLTFLDIHGCPNITQFPRTAGNIEYLLLGDTGIEVVPNSVQNLNKLTKLSLMNCRGLRTVSRYVFELDLSEFSLEGCSNVDEITLDVENSDGILPQISDLHLGHCPKIKNFAILVSKLKSIFSLDLSGYREIDKLLETLPRDSLSGFYSVRFLNLSECRLYELPCVLSNLTNLMHLYLSGNEFEELSLGGFSQLEYVQIDHCRRLRWLRDFPVPSRVYELKAYNCVKLETLPDKNVVFGGKLDVQQRFWYMNCFELDENVKERILGDSRVVTQLMANHVQKRTQLDSRTSSYSVCFPQTEVPEWITAKNTGSTVTFNLPPNWYNKKFFGFTTCIVADIEGELDDSLFFVLWSCKFTDYNKRHLVAGFADYQTIGDKAIVNNDHLYLATPNCDWYEVDEEDEKGGDDDMEIEIEYDYDDDGSDACGVGLANLEKFSSCREAVFEFYIADTDRYELPNYRIKKCGVSLVYADEEDDDYESGGGDMNSEQKPRSDWNSILSRLDLNQNVECTYSISKS